MGGEQGKEMILFLYNTSGDEIPQFQFTYKGQYLHG